MFLYTCITWLVANLLHPAMMILTMILLGTPVGEIFDAESFSILVLFFSYSIFFSIPLLLISWGLLYIIMRMHDNMLVSFIVWLIATAILIILEVIVILVHYDEEIKMQNLILALPAIAATWLSIIFRWKRFINLSYQLKINNHENNLV